MKFGPNTDILLLGSDGFLGNRLLTVLQGLGCPVLAVGKEYNLTSGFPTPDHTRYQVFAPKFIFHCAMDYQSVLNQIIIDTNVLRGWQSNYPEAELVAFGSDRMYSNDLPKIERNCLLGDLPDDDDWFDYATAKRMLYTVLRHDVIGKWHFFIPASLYGAGFDLADNPNMVHDVVQKIVRGKKLGTSIQVGSRIAFREVVWVQDFIDNMLAFLEKNGSGQAVNLGGYYASVAQIVNETSWAVGIDPNRIKSDTVSIPTNRRPISSEWAMKKLGSEYRQRFSEGIKEVVEYVEGEVIG